MYTFLTGLKQSADRRPDDGVGLGEDEDDPGVMGM